MASDHSKRWAMATMSAIVFTCLALGLHSTSEWSPARRPGVLDDHLSEMAQQIKDPVLKSGSQAPLFGRNGWLYIGADEMGRDHVSFTFTSTQKRFLGLQQRKLEVILRNNPNGKRATFVRELVVPKEAF